MKCAISARSQNSSCLSVFICGSMWVFTVVNRIPSESPTTGTCMCGRRDLKAALPIARHFGRAIIMPTVAPGDSEEAKVTARVS